MAKKKSGSSRSSHQGYGMPNIARARFPKKQIQEISKKKVERCNKSRCVYASSKKMDS